MNDLTNITEHPEPLQLGMLLYPNLTLLDLVGPQAVLGMHARTHLVWKTLDVVMSDSGVGIQPTATLDTCPKDLDILFVPGGMGTAQAMEDPTLLQFLWDRAPRARYVTSVCSGSLLLAAAGLLRGYRSTSHWAALEFLRGYGAEPVKARVVVDRNRFSGGGVTAGIDFGLTLLAHLRGEDTAKLTQLMLEYDPAPPFNAGTPDAAGPEMTERVLQMLDETQQHLQRLSDEARSATAA
ncbi:DJ-1/PfpI family protein [Corallococcus sp. bb12-1]|uniref:DJ-1/PfpI family protein n=1 Tax=Corallococcus sp. bb12-1 TaxID=2996784 RepID=UPI00227088A3|nr:DJ-1/PfpI family protein [Corallococcus sp. bb12-1]MCY1040212.1 DJ-1/PfpI family protein [Corallococcus sp. bb12-1]